VNSGEADEREVQPAAADLLGVDGAAAEAERDLGPRVRGMTTVGAGLAVVVLAVWVPTPDLGVFIAGGALTGAAPRSSRPASRRPPGRCWAARIRRG
jgi:hypothetical protein